MNGVEINTRAYVATRLLLRWDYLYAVTLKTKVFGDYNHARLEVSWITSTRGLLLRGYTGDGAQDFTCSWLDVDVFTVIARKREKNFLPLRSMMEVDDRINISNHSLFKKRDACHSCIFAKALSKFQRRLAMIKGQSLASELRYLVHGQGKLTKSHYAFCWNRQTWTLLRVMSSFFDKTRLCLWFGS